MIVLCRYKLSNWCAKPKNKAINESGQSKVYILVGLSNDLIRITTNFRCQNNLHLAKRNLIHFDGSHCEQKLTGSRFLS